MPSRWCVMYLWLSRGWGHHLAWCVPIGHGTVEQDRCVLLCTAVVLLRKFCCVQLCSVAYVEAGEWVLAKLVTRLHLVTLQAFVSQPQNVEPL